MSHESKYNKSDFIKFMMSTIEHNTSDKEKAKEYLSSQGLDVSIMLSDGLKRIKKMQLQIEAKKTKEEMLSADAVKQKASEWVDQLISNIDFSFPELVKQEELAISFRNIESLSKEDIKNILIKHFTLKFLEEQNKIPK